MHLEIWMHLYHKKIVKFLPMFAHKKKLSQNIAFWTYSAWLYSLYLLLDYELLFGLHTPLMRHFQKTSRSMILWPVNLVFGLCCRQGHSVSRIFFSLCVQNSTILPKISNLAPFKVRQHRLYLFSKIANYHWINFILMHKQIREVLFFNFLRFLRRIWLFNRKISNCEHIQLSIITYICIQVIDNSWAKCCTDESRNMDCTNIFF